MFGMGTNYAKNSAKAQSFRALVQYYLMYYLVVTGL